MKADGWNARAQSQIRAQLAKQILSKVSFPDSFPEPAFESPKTAYIGHEKDIHELIIGECRKRRWYFVHSRTDRRTTTAIGTPDFVIAADRGRTFYCEIKKKGGKLSQDQTIVKHCLLGLNQRYKTIYSFDQFIDFINEDDKMGTP